MRQEVALLLGMKIVMLVRDPIAQDVWNRRDLMLIQLEGSEQLFEGISPDQTRC